MFSALSEERIFSGSEHRREDSRRRWLSLVFVALAYALVIGVVFYQRANEPPPSPEEIPVEIVVEQPPPPPPPPAAQPAPQPTEAPKPPDVDLTPAHELPKAGTAETDNGDKEKDAKAAPAPEAEDKTHDKLSGAEASAEAPKPEATPEPAPTPDTTTPPTPEASATPEPTPVETPMPAMKTTPDGDIPLAASPPKPQPESTAPPAPAKSEPPAGKSKFAPMFAALPDVDFGGAAIKSPGGGAARGTYLTIVYGMIMPRVRKPPDARSQVGRSHGAVVFSVDSQGRLVDRWIAEESGSRELDRAVFNAIGAAAPFPPPPAHGTVQLRFTYDGG